ncbi:hypothetical protein WMY93_032685 [Mugilogobius chulae]|uniref:L1 transposable element RRM domain-containing protein n=1 Tax=Mugilogobius chulae TaxID=88201 RepID=A0AAW0MU28_9GOBI
MFSRDRKRGSKTENKNLATPTTATSTDLAASTGHDYIKLPDSHDMIQEEDFPPLPLSVEGTRAKNQHTRKHCLHPLKKRVDVIESNTNKDGATILQLQERLVESERYSRRWNLKLYGVPESVAKEDVKKETIRICQSVFPEGKQKLPDVIDTVHRLGKLKENERKPRGIILQFSSRTFRDAVWKAAKNNSFLKERHLHFTEDLCAADRGRRAALWPVIEAARREGKIAYYVGPRAYINGKEVGLPGT